MLWNQVLHAHSRLQEEEDSGIEYVHHIVAHTLNHPEARWLGRWYLGETFPFAHESQFLTHHFDSSVAYAGADNEEQNRGEME